MSSTVPPAQEALTEALRLSEEILTDIELSRIPLSNIALKTGRLARLLSDFDIQRVMEYEVAGFPANQGTMTPEDWRLAGLASRYYTSKDEKTAEVKTLAYLESIGQLEQQIDSARVGVEAARDRDISIASANPAQWVIAPAGNYQERMALRNLANLASARLAARRSFMHRYVSTRHYELKFSSVASDVFSRIRTQVDGAIASIVPDAVKRFAAVHENLRSENPEDWSNAVHSCRRILQDLADAVYPPAAEDKVIQREGKEIRVKLGPDRYINRIVAFVENNEKSQRFTAVVGSHLAFLGDRLDAVFSAAQKGSHTTIVSREEAERYVLYTYMLVGDILRLNESPDSPRSNNSLEPTRTAAENGDSNSG